MQSSVPLPNNEVFTSWKEIASYLNKGVRTVQRWEAEFGLPVRRPRERTRGIVQASRMDIDRWLDSRWSRRALLATQRSDQQFQLHRSLREQNHQLLKDVQLSVQKLVLQCDSLHKQLEVSQQTRTAAVSGKP